jgi:hypothetical protein
VPPSPLPLPDGPQSAATALWLLATAVASLLCGILSLLLFGAFLADIFYLQGWFFLLWWFFALGVACGLTGVVLGRVARTRRAALGRCGAMLAEVGLVLSYGGMLLPLAFMGLFVLLFNFAGPFPLAP